MDSEQHQVTGGTISSGEAQGAQLDVSRYREFVLTASRILRASATESWQGILAAARTCQARWHPNGFIIFHLGSADPEMAALRMHLWPSGERAVRPWGPRIHAHGWHLASLVVVGEYYDILYMSQATADEQPGWMSLNLHSPENGPDETDIVRSLDQTVCLREDKQRRVTAGESHDVPAGVFHDTTIAANQLVVTLMTQSARLGLGPSLLAGPERVNASYRRPELEEPQRHDLLDEVSALTA
jgi:hypothetical protein